VTGPSTSAELVLLDLDGCLIDSTAAITGSIRHALRAADVVPPPADRLRWCIGPPLLESLRSLLAEAGADPASAERCLDAYREHYRDSAAELTRVVPGVADVLEVLAARAELAVVTSKPGPAALPLIEQLGLGEYLVGVHAPAEDHAVEPKATTLGRALAAHGRGRPPRAAVMVGDRSHDVAAGVACGTGTVGVTWGAGDREELVWAGAGVVVDAPVELPDAIARARGG
jgi:phosphoglycolate phosphatase